MIELNDVVYLAAFGELITLLNGFHSNAFPTAVTNVCPYFGANISYHV